MVKSGAHDLLTRREFAGGFAALAASNLDAKRIPIAVQLFSLRRQCEQDLEGTLAYVREVGFQGVELAGAYGRSAGQLKELLEKNSLKCCGSHTPLAQLEAVNLKPTVEFSRILQNRNLIIPGLPNEYERSATGWRQAAVVLNRIADELRPLGMRVGYHNHAIEFRPIDGVIPWKLLYEDTRPDVILQLDTGNARIGGADPTALVREYPGRAVTVHVKDYLPKQTDPVIGSSDFDWNRFLRTCAAYGSTEWYIIEHDSPKREDIKICFDRFAGILKTAG